MPETPKRPKYPKQPITFNFDKRFDTKFQSDYDLPSTNEFPNMTKHELEMITQKVTYAQKYVGGRKSAAKSTEKKVNLMEI